MIQKLQQFSRITLSFVIAVIMLSGSITPRVYAGPCSPEGLGIFTTFPTWYQYLDLDGNCEVQSFEVPGDVWKVGLAVVEMVLRIAGLVATVYVIYAGFKYVMSRGNPQEAAKARQTIIDAVIGIAISSVATVLVAFLGRRLTQ